MMKVLVADDSQTIRSVAETILSQVGCETLTVEDGFEALVSVSENRPDCVILDVMMPKLDGFQVCSVLKESELTKTIPVILLSSKDSLFDRARGRMVGANAYLGKPFTKEELQAAILKVAPHEPESS